MEPWVWIGQRYWAVSVRVTPGGGALSAERSPFLAISWSRTTGPARIESNSVAASGSPAPGDHVACSVRAARTASHSRSATTARKLCMRTTRAPAMDPIDVSSTLTSVAPWAGGRMTRACSIPGRTRSWT